MNKVSKKSRQCEKSKNRVNLHRGVQRILIKEKQQMNKLVKRIEHQHTVVIDSEQLSHVQDEDIPIVSCSDKLRCWTLRYNVTRRAVNDLLVILKDCGMNWLPADSRSLCKTPRNIDIVSATNGKYWYNGIDTNIRQIFSNISEDIVLELNFNVDGVPFFKSSCTEFWPILCNIHSE